MAALQDLTVVRSACRATFKDIPVDFYPEISEEIWALFKPQYEAVTKDSIASTHAYGFVLINKKGASDDVSDSETSETEALETEVLETEAPESEVPEKESSAISSRWLLYAYAYGPYYRALVAYRNVTQHLSSFLFASAPLQAKKKEILKLMPSKDWQSKVDAKVAGTSVKILDAIDRHFTGRPDDRTLYLRFLSEPDLLGGGKTLNRPESDWMGSSIRKAAYVIQANSDRLPQVIRAVADSEALDQAIRNTVDKQLLLFRGRALPVSTGPRVTGAVNVIYYGAPGTGKSYRICERTKKSPDSCTFRTVFHADTQSGDFIGMYRPAMDKGSLTYAFQPGPFSLALVAALNDPERHYFLVIEEINRAPAAAVFGEVFQLLDRDVKGGSGYSVKPGDIAFADYLKANVPGWDGEIRLPSNLSLLASMNSGDQGVMPLDTAFKRRWMYEYVPVDFGDCASGNLQITDRSGVPTAVSWKAFAIAVNSILEEIGVPEDRLLGPFFLSKEELAAGSGSGSSSVLSKLFLYLWDDVLRHAHRGKIFAPELGSYGRLVSAYAANKPVFSDVLMRKLFPDTEAIGQGDDLGS